MLNLSNLSPQPGSRKQRKRLGRGQGSGQGKQAGKGHKGYKARSGSSIRPGFEGGQMPIYRRLPKRGFTNIYKDQFSIVNVDALGCYEDGAKVDRQSLIDFGLVSSKFKMVKILGNGDLSKKLTIAVDKLSKSARQKIEAAGGTIEE